MGGNGAPDRERSRRTTAITLPGIPGAVSRDVYELGAVVRLKRDIVMNEHTCLSRGDQGIVREHNLAFGIYRVDFGSSGTFHLFDFDITDRPVPA